MERNAKRYSRPSRPGRLQTWARPPRAGGVRPEERVRGIGAGPRSKKKDRPAGERSRPAILPCVAESYLY